MINPLQDKPLISVVIPLYCEGSNLSAVLSKNYMILESLKEPYEIILIDDGSTDNTWTVIENEVKNYPMLRAIRLSRNFGKESALFAGIEESKGNVVITLDGDMQHPPELIPEMVQKWRESGANVVEAVKEYRGKESFLNKIGAVIFYYILNKLSGYDLNNASDFKLMDRKAINALINMGEQGLFFRGMSAWLGFKRVQIPFKVLERSAGSSGWSFFHLIKLSITAVTSFSSLPLHIITILGSLFFIFGLALGIQTLLGKLTGTAVSGFTTVILLQLIIGSSLMISLGIIGEYIAKIFNEVKKRPRYVLRERINTVTKEVSA